MFKVFGYKIMSYIVLIIVKKLLIYKGYIFYTV